MIHCLLNCTRGCLLVCSVRLKPVVHGCASQAETQSVQWARAHLNERALGLTRSQVRGTSPPTRRCNRQGTRAFPAN